MDNHQEHHHGFHRHDHTENIQQAGSGDATVGAGAAGARESEMDEQEKRMFERIDRP